MAAVAALNTEATHLRHLLPWHALFTIGTEPRADKVELRGILAHRKTCLTAKEAKQWGWCMDRFVATLLEFAGAQLHKARVVPTEAEPRATAPSGEDIMEAVGAHDVAQLLADACAHPAAMRHHVAEFPRFAEYGGAWPTEGLRRAFVLALYGHVGINALLARSVLPPPLLSGPAPQGGLALAASALLYQLEPAVARRFYTWRTDDHLFAARWSQLDSLQATRQFAARLWQELATVVAICVAVQPTRDWHTEVREIVSLHVSCMFHQCSCVDQATEAPAPSQ
jgi:hypothetical protein